MNSSHHDDSNESPPIEDAFDPDTAPSRLNAVQPRTELGARLLQRRRAIIAAGIPLLSWQEIEAELNEQRQDR
ncbi:MAG TPA: hypothetical protein VHV31_11110 [Nitrolancea sp.]|nr:hypothetical protein [Nitrolancea sp.]